MPAASATGLSAGKMQGLMVDRISSADCLVVGGGLIGMLSARELAQAGLSVILLEQGTLCRESSWAGGGILSPLIPWDYPDAVNELVRWSQRRYPGLAAELLEESGIDPEWTRSGLLLLGCGLEGHVRTWHERFPCQMQQVPGAELQAVEPGISDGPGPALLLPDVAQIRNPRLGQALARALAGQGIDIREHCRVTGLRVAGDRVQGVSTSRGDFSAEHVIIAGGAWSAGIIAQQVPDIAVEPVLGQMIMFEATPEVLRHIVVYQGHYLIPRRDGLILAGSTLEHTGYRKEVTKVAQEMLSRFAVELLPALSAYPLVGHWAGLRPGTPDGIPLIGELQQIKGLFLNAGHYRNGVGMAPAAARLLVDGLLGRASFTDPAPYVPPVSA